MADPFWKHDSQFLRDRQDFLRLLRSTPGATRALVAERFGEELADQLIERCYAEMDIDRRGDVIALTTGGATYLDNLETGRG